MEKNPYRRPVSSSPNPYLQSAMADATTAKIIAELYSFVSDESMEDASDYTPVTGTGPFSDSYVSATDSAIDTVCELFTPLPEKTHSAYISATDASVFDEKSTYTSVNSDKPRKDYIETQSPDADPGTIISRSDQLSKDLEIKSGISTPYLSPEESWELEKKREKQAVMEAKLLAERQYQQEQQAKKFLVKLEKLDPLEGTRMWFEDFAKLCPSRLEAAIEFLATTPS